MTRSDRFRAARRSTVLVLAAATTTLALRSSAPDPPKASLVPVRFPEGMVHGFLELRNGANAVIAHGDLLQTPSDSAVEIRLVLRFKDKSFFEETTVFTQHKVFRLRSYHLIQRGPAFERDLDASLSGGGRYQVSTRSHHDGETKRYAGDIEDPPADISNGLPVTLAKNLSPRDTATVHLVAFTPKPRLVGLRFAYEGRDSVSFGDHRERVTRFELSPRLGTVTKLFAKLLGKLPPDSHLWILTDDVPAFVRFQGPMYDGPVWRLELTTPHWESPNAEPQ